MAEHEREDKHEGGGSHGGGGHGGGGHGGGHAEGEHEGAPEWLISFADNVMLIMAFFVIMLAMNMGPKGSPVQGGDPAEKENYEARRADFVIGIREAFNAPLDIDDPSLSAVLRKRLIQKRDSGRSMQPEEPGAGRESQSTIPTERSSRGGSVSFDDDEQTLSASGRERVQAIAATLKGSRFRIEVRGHASPSETMRREERGIALGYGRAVSVANALVAGGLRWEQLRVVSCGDHERQTQRTYDRDADRSNQRVEIIVTGETITEPPRPGTSGDASTPSTGSQPAAGGATNPTPPTAKTAGANPPSGKPAPAKPAPVKQPADGH
ncbi:MAG: OmpA family protein [Phycisphaerales bacterium]